jgi:hypothetical protein
VRSLILSAFISLSISFSGAALVTAQQGRGEGLYTIAVDVDPVVFNVTVTDSRGRHRPGLKQADFHIMRKIVCGTSTRVRVVGNTQTTHICKTTQQYMSSP